LTKYGISPADAAAFLGRAGTAASLAMQPSEAKAMTMDEFLASRQAALDFEGAAPNEASATRAMLQAVRSRNPAQGAQAAQEMMRMYSGFGDPIKGRFDVSKADPKADMGRALYASTSPEVASQSAMDRLKSKLIQPTGMAVYPLDIPKQSILFMEQEYPAELAVKLKKFANKTPMPKGPTVTGEDLYQGIRTLPKEKQGEAVRLLGFRGAQFLPGGKPLSTDNFAIFNTDGTVSAITGKQFKEGGEVTNDEFIQQMMVGTVPEDLPRSRGLLPKEIREAVDVPLDFLNLGVRGTIGAVAGPAYGLYKGITSEKFGTPEGVREAGSKAGEMMQRITGVPKTETARDVLEFAEKTMEPAKIPFMPQFLTLPTPGPGAARALMKSYEFAETPPEGAVKPRGGLFAGEDRPESGLNKYLKSTTDAADQLVSDNDLTPDRAQTIQSFIAKQGKKYLTTTYGTAFDPLREALLSGRAPRLGKDRTTFKEYLMEGLGSKKDRVSSEAREDFEKLYDQKTGIEATSFVGDSNYKIGQAIRDAEKQKMIDEGARLKEGGLEDFEINPIHVVDQNLENMERSWSPQYKKDLAAILKATPEGQEKTVTDPLARGLLEGEVLYDVKPYGLDALEPKNAVNALATLTDEELKKRDFPEAIIEGMKRTRLVREWDEVLDRAEKNKPINKELFDLGVEDILPMGDDRWVRVMTKPAVQLEGKAMHHSVGGYANKVYNLGGKEAFNSGKARVFSLRGSDGYPRITVEARHLDDGKLEITQIKGRYNGLPTPEDQQKTIGFLLTMPISSVKSFESYSMDTNGKKLPESVEVEWRDMYQKAVQQQQE
jgi:hypothetical protein